MPRLPFFGALRSRLPGARALRSAAEAPAPPLPPAEAIVEAFDQPVLLVRERRVRLANRAALDVLGAHILGSDVRLAIRHPAAAERLTRDEAEHGEEPPIELAGLGEQDRRWELATARIGGDMLVRLTDRSETHAAERMRIDFVANASHELRTPLATLIGYLETLQDEAAASDPEIRTRFLAIMTGEAKRMQQLVDDLMSLSRIEAQRFRPPRETVDLVPLIDEARANLAQLLEARGTRIELANEASATRVAGERQDLLQLVTNLLDNAAKYGGAEPVTVRLEDAPSAMLLISVVDRGEGVSPEHLPHLTRRFYRADAGRSRAAGGTGLGLAIVKHIVERHRGRLDIRSRLGEGTAVQVWLPRADETLS